MGAYLGSVRVAGFIAPTDTSDTYAVTDDRFNVGGHRVVADLTERDAITAQRRRLGMLVKVMDSGGGVEKYYTLRGGIANGNWVEEAMGGGSASLIASDATITVYVSLTGSDVTGNGSFGNPYQSMVGVEKHINAYGYINTLVVYFMPGSYTIAQTLNYYIKNRKIKQLQFLARPTSEWTVITTGTMTSNTYFTHTDTSKSWTANEHRGRFVRKESTGELFAIGKNNATTVWTPGADSFGVELIGAYSILEHAVTLDFSEAVLRDYMAGTWVSWYFANLRLQGTCDSMAGTYFSRCHIRTANSDFFAWTIAASVIDYGSCPNPARFGEMNKAVALNDLGVELGYRFAGGGGNSFVEVGQSIIMPGTAGQKAVAGVRFRRWAFVYDNLIIDFKYGHSFAFDGTSSAPLTVYLSDQIAYDNVSWGWQIANGVKVLVDPAWPMASLGTPIQAQATFDGATEISKYVDLDLDYNVLCLKPAYEGYEIRVARLEDVNVIFEVFALHSGGAAGTVPTHTGAILQNRYESAGDALAVQHDSYGRPIDSPATDANGNIVYVTSIIGSGDYTLSAVPVVNTAIVYQIELKLKNANNVPESAILLRMEQYAASRITNDTRIPGYPTIKEMLEAMSDALWGEEVY